MKSLFTLLALLMFGLRLSAQTVAPVRLAIFTDSPEAMSALDTLTVDLSKNDRFHLLERAEIEKVYREQGMSAANRDDLKLGRLLGADGLMILDVVRTSRATNLMAPAGYGSRKRSSLYS